MASFNRKVKRAMAKKENKEPKVDKWENLMDMRKSSIDTYVKQHSLLIETQKLFKDAIDKDEVAKQIVQGANESFKEITDRIKFTMDRHITFEPSPDGNGNVIKEYKQGVVDQNGDEMFDYLAIMNDYVGIHTDLMNVGTNSHITLLDRLKVFSKAIKDEDIKMLKSAYSKGQDKILETLKSNPKGGKHGRKSK